MRIKSCFSSKRRGIDNTNWIFNIININFSFLYMNCRNKTSTTLPYSGWIKSNNTYSNRWYIPTHRRRRFGSGAMNHGTVVVVVSVLKRSKGSNTFWFFSWSKDGVRSSCFVVYLVLSISKRAQQLGPGLVQYKVLYSQFDEIFDRFASPTVPV